MQSSCQGSDKQLFIRFPTVTKLTYPFEAPSEGQLLKTSYRSNQNIRQHIRLTLLSSKTEDFKIVQLPPKHEIMNICRMTMREKPQKPPDSPPRKKIFSVTKNKHETRNSLQQQGKRNSRKSLRKLSLPPPVAFDLAETYPHIARLISLSFGVRVQSELLPRMRRAKVEDGNNSLLVRQIIKKRSWWTIISDDSKSNQQPEQLNLIWSQHSLSSKHLQKLAQNNVQCMKDTVSRYQDEKNTFPKHLDRILSQLPKVKQLFFNQWEEQPARFKDWLFEMTQQELTTLRNDNLVVSNHLSNHKELTDKKMLHKNMVQHYQGKGENPYLRIPYSYHLTCYDWQQAVQEVLKEERQWILKPGENTNQGRGILIFRSSKEAAEHLLLHPPTHESRSFLLQHYVTPSLYSLRKYDLRCFILGLQIGPCLRFYWYEEGYVRTASRKFSMKGTAKGIHLTNDAVQKHLKHYGEHEPNNKLSFQELDKYMLNNETFSLYKDVLPQMKTIARDTCQAVGERLGGKSDVAFELMGLDFLVDELGRPWLLEVNTNPSLETSCNLLTRIIPEVLQNTMRLLDVFLGSKKAYEYGQHFLMNNKFSLLHVVNGV